MPHYDSETINALIEAMRPLIQAARARARALQDVANGIPASTIANETLAQAQEWKRIADAGSFAIDRARGVASAGAVRIPVLNSTARVQP